MTTGKMIELLDERIKLARARRDRATTTVSHVFYSGRLEGLEEARALVAPPVPADEIETEIETEVR